MKLPVVEICFILIYIKMLLIDLSLEENVLYPLSLQQLVCGELKGGAGWEGCPVHRHPSAGAIKCRGILLRDRDQTAHRAKVGSSQREWWSKAGFREVENSGDPEKVAGWLAQGRWGQLSLCNDTRVKLI